jgi:hypothetical protein
MGKQISKFWCQSGALLGRVDRSFMNSVTGSGFVAKCSNIIVDLSFMNSVTGSRFLQSAQILQDSVIKLFTVVSYKFSL